MTTASTKRHILISGAGIAGLTTALCLSRQGFKVDVFEKAGALDPIGAGIQLSPNAYRILSSLGMDETLRQASVFPDRITIHSGRSGKTVNIIPLGETIRHRFGFPYCVIHRGDLQKLLLDHCQKTSSINLHFAATISEFEDTGEMIHAQISGKSRKQGNALVVADGVWSELRGKLGMPEPEYSGKVAWRALLSAESLSDQALLDGTHLWLAPKSHAVTYPVQNSNLLNIIVITDGIPEHELAHLGTSQPYQETWFDNFGENLAGAINKADQWTAWPIFQTPEPLKLSSGNVAIMGDAAHAMLPFAAQGAAMAIEDAAVLANCLSTHPVRAGIERFEHQRI
ncbi:MAG: FAD-dependent monooxygenase, partial [Pseudomonadota bacterium]